MPAGERSLWIVADDLSGAADCAAGFADAFGTVALGLTEVPSDACNVAVDTDSRAMERDCATACVASAFARVPDRARGRLLYKKIDSTLRGHVAAELAAALDATAQFSGVVIAPSFPEQGRTLRDGRLWVNGQPVDGPQADLITALAAAGLRAALVQAPLPDPAPLRQQIANAMSAGVRVVVVDALDTGDLARLAAALLDGEPPPWLLAGSAGLARAVARQLAPAKAQDVPSLAGPVLALVGSFSPASAAQLRQLEASGSAQVVRLAAGLWRDPVQARRIAVAAQGTLRAGRCVALAIDGEVVQPFSREPAGAMARAALSLLGDAGTCVLTGGDTARALFDALGVRQLQVIGELEPGISRVRCAGARPGFVLKAGGFGDAATLERIIAYSDPPRRPIPARQSENS